MEKTKKKKIIFLIINIFITVICFTIVAIFFYDMFKFKNIDKKLIEEENKPAITQLNLTTEQKLQDFEYFYDVISTSFPFLNNSKKVTGVDFVANKENYINRIKNTKDDYEFYLEMIQISRDLYSAHTDIVFPEKKSYKNSGYYNRKKVLSEDDVFAYCGYWNKLIENHLEILKQADLIFLSYIDGKYYLEDDNGINSKQILHKINGEDCDKYIVENFRISKLNYDHFYNKSHECGIGFNTKVGEPIKLEFIDENGVVSTVNCYYSPEYELSSYVEKVYSNDFFNVILDDVPTHKDIENDIFYIKLNNMYVYNEKAVVDSLSKIGDSNNIIFDFRNNYGGMTDFAMKYIYPYLFSTDINIINKVYMIDSKYNKNLMITSPLRLFFENFKFKKADKNINFGEPDNSKKILMKSLPYEYKGGDVKDRNIYFLIGNGSVSAADGFVSMLKENKLATLVGENTLGEGIIDSYRVDILPNSKLLFTYTHAKGFNADGTCNSFYGTAPDVYVRQTAKGIDDFYKIWTQNQDPYTYQNRLLWDDALIETLNLIKKENK